MWLLLRGLLRAFVSLTARSRGWLVAADSVACRLLKLCPPVAGHSQVVNLHYMLSKTVVKARPSVLWCYKNELYLSSHKKKRMKQIKKMAQVGRVNRWGCGPAPATCTAVYWVGSG